ETVAPLSGEVTTAVGATVSTLNTVTVIGAEVVTLPTRSRATAVSVCVPFAVRTEFHETLYGLVVSSAPRLAPSILNCTPATPRLSLALADTVVVPLMLAPAAGAVSATAGGVVSGVKRRSVQ